MPQAFDVAVGGTVAPNNAQWAEPIYWRNDFDYPIYIREITVWQGVSLGAVADILFSVLLVRDEQTDIQTVLTGSWDHYAEPTMPDHSVSKTYNPHYALMPPGAYLVFQRRGAAIDEAKRGRPEAGQSLQMLHFWYTQEP